MNQNLSRITGVAMLSLTLATVGAPIAQASASVLTVPAVTATTDPVTTPSSVGLISLPTVTNNTDQEIVDQKTPVAPSTTTEDKETAPIKTPAVKPAPAPAPVKPATKPTEKPADQLPGLLITLPQVNNISDQANMSKPAPKPTPAPEKPTPAPEKPTPAPEKPMPAPDKQPGMIIELPQVHNISDQANMVKPTLPSKPTVPSKPSDNHHQGNATPGAVTPGHHTVEVLSSTNVKHYNVRLKQNKPVFKDMHLQESAGKTNSFKVWRVTGRAHVSIDGQDATIVQIEHYAVGWKGVKHEIRWININNVVKA